MVRFSFFSFFCTTSIYAFRLIIQHQCFSFDCPVPAPELRIIYDRIKQKTEAKNCFLNVFNYQLFKFSNFLKRLYLAKNYIFRKFSFSRLSLFQFFLQKVMTVFFFKCKNVVQAQRLTNGVNQVYTYLEQFSELISFSFFFPTHQSIPIQNWGHPVKCMCIINVNLFSQQASLIPLKIYYTNSTKPSIAFIFLQFN